MIRMLIFGSILVTALFLAGCARTVTVRPDVGNRMNIEISFRGEVDTAANRYYMVFGGNSPHFIDKNRYFFAPGEDYDREKLDISTEAAYYYDNFFSTWSDFMKLKDNVFYINNGPFSSLVDNFSYTPVLLSYRTIPSAGSDDAKKIKLIFDLSKFPPPLPTEIYFNFLSIGPDSKMSDLLGSTDNKISVNIGSSIHNISESPDMSIDGSLDIISWKVEIE
ncbi:MAG: hypothetical protein WC527_04020 [Candidatus Margulisiibacteriota bacterium]